MLDEFSVSIIIPTLNSAKTLGNCLESIAQQAFPAGRLELILADAGSQDNTLEIIEDFRRSSPDIRTKVVGNALKTGEAGKAAALKFAANRIIAFIDSDNVLEDASWLKRMVEPFADHDIVAAEPIRYTWRKSDGAITRYCALLGMNDPLCYFLGNYDRESILSGRWTRMPHTVVDDNERYLSLRLDPRRLPTIGANGFFVKKEILDALKIGDYFFDIDILGQVLARDPMKKVAKVKIGIVHIFCGTIKDFVRKQRRRIADYRHFRGKGERTYGWNETDKMGLAYFVFSCVLVFPLLWQSLRGFAKSRDGCMFLHPIFCILTFYIYLFGFLGRLTFYSRRSWQVK